jgi:hypothetical protein
MSFKLSRATSQSVPEGLTKNVDSGTTAFAEGALLLLQSDDEWAECGADPASIGAVALHGYGTSTAIGAHFGRVEFPTGKCLAIPVQGKVWRAQYIGTPALGDCGVVKDSDGKWKVDFSDTTNDRVTVTKILNNTELGGFNEVECFFIASVIQVVNPA